MLQCGFYFLVASAAGGVVNAEYYLKGIVTGLVPDFAFTLFKYKSNRNIDICNPRKLYIWEESLFRNRYMIKQHSCTKTYVTLTPFNCDNNT